MEKIGKVRCRDCGLVVKGGHLGGDKSAPIIAERHYHDGEPCTGAGKSAELIEWLWIESALLTAWLFFRRLRWSKIWRLV